jgi:osmotically-inducible protein OsmY
VRDPSAPEYLVARIRQALATDPRTGELELDIEVVGDRIYLTGTVATEERREAVEAVVREVAPDQEVSNGLGLPERPDAGPEEALP